MLKLDLGSERHLEKVEYGTNELEGCVAPTQAEATARNEALPCSSVTEPMSPTKQEQENSAAPRRFTWIKNISQRFNQLQNNLSDCMQPSIPPGYVRVSWTCVSPTHDAKTLTSLPN